MKLEQLRAKKNDLRQRWVTDSELPVSFHHPRQQQRCAQLETRPIDAGRSA
jgi:hypothetical protein